MVRKLLRLSNWKRAYQYYKKNGFMPAVYASLERLQNKNTCYEKRELQEEELERQRRREWGRRERFSILAPAYETEPAHFREMVESVLRQSYPDFELIVADASRTDTLSKVIGSYQDERIRYIRLLDNRGISENTNAALGAAKGGYIALLDHDDILEADALYQMMDAIEACGEKYGKRPYALYSDEDKCSADAGVFFSPHYKPGFNLDLLLSNNYICHLLVMEAGLMKELAFRAEYDGAQDHDLILRAVKKLEDMGYGAASLPEAIVHVPQILYHWRCHTGSTSANPASKRYAYEAGRRAVEDFCRRQGWKAKAVHTEHLGFYRVLYQGDVLEQRPDLAAVGGSSFSHGRIAGGAYGEDGMPLYRGLNRHFSGYMHRAVLQQDAAAVDIGNLKVRNELKPLLAQIKGLEKDPALASLRFGREAAKRGYRILWDPLFEAQKAERKATAAQASVVIPNFNGMQYIGSCLRSLYACEETAFSVIVVDNGSKDGSADYIEKEFPQAELIRFPENRGFSAAVNAGILAAKTPYVILLNNDTTVEKYFVSTLVRAIGRNERYFSVGAKMVSMQNPDIIDDAGDYYCAFGWAFARGKGKPARRYRLPCDIFAACGGAAIYRREALCGLGLFDEAHFAYLEDIDIGYRARLYGYRNRYAPDAVVRHAGSGASGSRYNAFKIRLSSRNSVYLIAKNMPPLQILLNLPFLLCGFFLKFLFFAKRGYGKLYAQGLWKGLLLSLSGRGRKRRIPFERSRLRQYLRIEGELLYNLFVRRILD